jgi:hypothetical protein
VRTALDQIQGAGPKQLKKGLEDWNTEDGLILYGGKVYVPRDIKLRTDLIRAHHDALEAGHPGEYKTLELITRNYWWPGITAMVKHYVKTCDQCNRKKKIPGKRKVPLNPIPPPDLPWQTVTNDFIVELPESDGYNAIWVVADHLTKEAHFVPTTTEIDTEGTVDLYLNHIWRLHGLPTKMISDRGTQFTSHLMRGIFKRLKIEGNYSTAYHPQTDGQTERINQQLKQYLRLYCSYRQDDWSKYLAMAEFAYNNAIHESTKKSPFYVSRGYHPRTILSQVKESNSPQADEMVDRIQQLHEEIKAAMRLSQENMKNYYDRRAEDRTFQEGDQVWLDAQNINTTAPSRTLADRRLGPYRIEKKLSDTVYLLKLPHQMHIHPVFHAALLYPYQENDIPGRNQEPPPPIEIEGEEEYEVEEILDGRLWYRKKQYLVRWKGYTAADDTWEPASNLKRSAEAIQEFHDKHPDFEWKSPADRKRHPRKSPVAS